MIALVSPINTFTIHNIVGMMAGGSLAVMFYVVYLKAGRRLLDLVSANFILCATGLCLTSFLSDNMIPAGMSAYGWPGGPTAEALKMSSLEIHRWAWICGMVCFPTQLHFVLVYCQKQNFLRRHIAVVYCLAVLAVPLVWTNSWVAPPNKPLADTSSWTVTFPWMPEINGPGPTIMSILILTLQIYGLVLMWQSRKLSAAELAESLSARRIVFAALLVQGLAGLADCIPSAMQLATPALIPVGSAVMAILLSIALIRSRIETDHARHQLQYEKAALLECVPQPLLYFGHDSRLQWANDSAAEFAGKKPDELAGSLTDEIWGAPGKDRPPIELAWEKAQPVKSEIVRGDKSIWIVNASPVINAKGRATGAVVLATDITEIRHAQQALRDSNIKILAAREEERRRVATDLHDSVAQGLTALQMHLGASGAKTAPGSPERKQFEMASKRCGDLGKEVRHISHQLYPPALDLLGLNAALEEVLAPYRSAGIDCIVECRDGLRKTRLSQDAEVALYRIAQESINNAIRHGKAKTIAVVLGITDDDVWLAVTDDGIGFETEKNALGLGMTSMTSRIAGIGGRLEVASRPGQTCVKAIVALANAKRKAPQPVAQPA